MTELYEELRKTFGFPLKQGFVDAVLAKTLLPPNVTDEQRRQIAEWRKRKASEALREAIESLDTDPRIRSYLILMFRLDPETAWMPIGELSTLAGRHIGVRGPTARNPKHCEELLRELAATLHENLHSAA